ncbi:hypothetical protein T439DRAFT_354147 [Meredithblackwellia eburnea MCA 4105]
MSGSELQHHLTTPEAMALQSQPEAAPLFLCQCGCGTATTRRHPLTAKHEFGLGMCDSLFRRFRVFQFSVVALIYEGYEIKTWDAMNLLLYFEPFQAALPFESMNSTSWTTENRAKNVKKAIRELCSLVEIHNKASFPGRAFLKAGSSICTYPIYKICWDMDVSTIGRLLGFHWPTPWDARGFYSDSSPAKVIGHEAPPFYGFFSHCPPSGPITPADFRSSRYPTVGNALFQSQLYPPFMKSASPTTAARSVGHAKNHTVATVR